MIAKPIPIDPQKGKEEFTAIYNKYISPLQGANKLYQYLCKAHFFEDPASTRFHSAVAGGLCQHSLNVYHRLRQLVAENLTEDGNLSPEQEKSVAVIGLLHDVCKANTYVESMRNQKTYDVEKVNAAPSHLVKHDGRGNFVWETLPYFETNDEVPYGHGEKSVYIVSSFITLTREEAMSIRWHMGFTDYTFQGGSNTVNAAFRKYPIACLTFIADLEATVLDEVEPKR